MLSSENPPPDIPCFSQISPLKSVACCCDERNPLPNFSIRDYVSSSRGKDIKNSWPFSQKNLQRCLKYGVKDVLPPFDESVYSVTSVERAAEIPRCYSSYGRFHDQHLPPTVKKCRLTVKLSNTPDEQTSNQDSISEKMASSNVCPVCKTFSSSSNTTLNAHIDQCLSGESSTVKWTETTSSKVVKRRVKPRKTRLMMDVYKTALHCTLEDLDRRNGTNWASNFGFPGQDSEAYSPVNVDEDTNEGGNYVYSDSDGTKVRVLSKLGDLPSGSDGAYDCGPSKATGRDKGNNISLSKKKNNLVRKQKLPNHSIYGQKNCSPGPKVNDVQQNKPEVSMDLDKLKTKSRVKSDVASIGDSLVIKSYSSTKSDKNPLLATESRKRNRPRKDSLSKAQDCRDRNDRLELISKLNDSSSDDHEYHVDPSNCEKNQVTALENGSSVFRSFMPTQHCTFSSEGKKFTSPGKRFVGRAIPSVCKNFASLRKKLLSVRHASVPESKKKMRRKHMDFKKCRLHCISGSEEEAVETLGENKAQIEHATGKSSIINKAAILETQKKRRGFVNAGKIGDMSLKSPDPSPELDSHGVFGINVDSTRGSFPVDAYKFEIRDGFVCEPSYGEDFVAFSRSLNSAYPGPAGTNGCECFSPRYNEAYVGHCNNELAVSGEHVLVNPSSCDMSEMNADYAQRNYFVDVDPIPIPGPPGSFLPSPGRMGSEELQGISSLTTCKIQSSEDEREAVDMCALDSPISTMSVVSNSFTPISRQSYFRHTSPENNQTPKPEKNARYSSTGYGPSLVVSSNSEARFTSDGDCDSPIKPTSNPVLRLMGKNLMVVNKDENPSPQTRLSTPCGIPTIENRGPWMFGVDNGLSTRSSHNDPHYFHPTFSGHPNCNLSDGFQVPSNFRSPQFLSKSFGGRFISPLESREYENERNLIGNPLGSNITRLDIRTAAYDHSIENVRNCIPHHNSGDLTVKAAHVDGVINDPFHGYDQTRVYPIYASGSRDIQYRNTQIPFSKEGNANLGKWTNCPAECSSAVQPKSWSSSSMLPTTVLKPSLYFPRHGYSRT